MKIQKHIITIILIVFSVSILLTGCTKISFIANRQDNAAFVRNAASQINNHKEIPEMLFAGDNFLIDLEQKPVFEPYYLFKDFKASKDKDDDSLIHYSCKIPGLVGTAFNIAYDRCFIVNDKFSKWVDVEGDLHVIKDEEGRRKIDISEGSNVFSVYAILRYPSPLLTAATGIDLSKGVTEQNRIDILDAVLNLGTRQYSELTGSTVEDYTEKVVQPELDSYIENMKIIGTYTNRIGYRMIDRYKALPVTGQIGIVSLALFLGMGLLYAIIAPIVEKLKPATSRKELREKWKEYVKKLNRDEKRHLRPRKYKLLLKDDREKVNYGWTLGKRVEAVNALSYPEDRSFLIFLLNTDEDISIRKAALEKLPYPEEKEVLIQCTENWGLGEAAVQKLPFNENKHLIQKLAQSQKYNHNEQRAAFEKIPYPEEKKMIIDIAVNTDDLSMEKIAVDTLKYPSDREEFFLYLLRRSDHNNAYDNKIFDKALSYFSYPDDREYLLRLAKEAKAPYVRKYVIEKYLPYPEEEETLTYIIDNDRSEDVLSAALKVIEKNSKNTEELLVRTAMNGKDPAARRKALQKLKYNKHRDVFLHAAEKDEDADIRNLAIGKLSFPADRDVLVRITQNDEDSQNRKLAREELPFLEIPAAYAHSDLLEHRTSDNDKIKGTIAFTLCPISSEQILRRLCSMIKDGTKADSKDIKLTIGGWAAAAMAKILTAEMTPDDIEPNRERLSLAIDHNNEIAEKARKIQKDLEPFVGKNFLDLSDKAMKMFDELNKLQNELDRGLGAFMLDNGDKPFAWLVYLLRDNQTRVPRFIKQGIIMGLLDWLMENTEHPEAKQLLETVISVRSDLIRSDNDLSFFEVRVPEDCTKDEYAQILSMVLHAANPSIKYCSAKNLLKLADNEVPGCLDMLQKYPLRLIDPVNKRTLGFYKFDPYLHAMWVQYQPPKDTGKVIARYHEVDDRTRPLSSGLNLQLFRDLYSVIPTIYHEYQHFCGDANEASVFLKTQVFSIGFYQRHKTAKASRDAVFARLTELLGLPPEVNKCEELNRLIKQYYGEETGEAEAMKHAVDELNRMNSLILMANMHEKWDPEIKFPLLNETEDKQNMELIRDIIIRWDMTPKSITPDEFSTIASWAAAAAENEEGDDGLQHRPD